MALQKLIKKENGVESSYHKIVSVNMTIMESDDDINSPIQMSIIYESYLNKEYRNNGKPIESNICSISLESDEQSDNILSVRQFAYNKMKELPEWEDAVDC